MGSAESISETKELKKEELEQLKMQLSDTASMDEEVAKITSKMNELKDNNAPEQEIKKYQDVLDKINDIKEQASQLNTHIDEGIEKCEDGKLTREKDDELVNTILTETSNLFESSMEVASMIFNINKPMSAEDLIEKIQAPHGEEASKYVTDVVHKVVIPLKLVIDVERYNELILKLSETLDQHDVVDERDFILQEWSAILKPYGEEAQQLVDAKISELNVDPECIHFKLTDYNNNCAKFVGLKDLQGILNKLNSLDLKEMADEYEKAFGKKLCFKTIEDLADINTQTAEYIPLKDAYLKSVHELETLNRCGTNSSDEEVMKILNEEWNKVGYMSEYDKIKSITKKKDELVKKINLINEILKLGKEVPYFDKVGCINSSDMSKLKDMKGKLDAVVKHIKAYNNEEKAKKIVENPSSQFNNDGAHDIDVLYKVYVEEIPERVASEKKVKQRKIVIGIVIGVVVLIIVLALTFVFKHKRPQQIQAPTQPAETM